jgi:hypothetical protein
MTDEYNGEFDFAELHFAVQHRGKGCHAASLGHKESRSWVFKNSPAYRLYLGSGYSLEIRLPYTYELAVKTHNEKRQSHA